jgi:2-polyprenyl-3-methyl-5-hydroxy-6-metoxy-1,4-benzoquinol methylase
MPNVAVLDQHKNQNRLLYSVNFRDKTGVSGWIFDLDDVLIPQIIDIYLNGIFFQRTRCAGLIDVRQVVPIPQTHLIAAWNEKTSGLRVMAGAFDFEIPEYVPRYEPIAVQVVHSDTGRKLFCAEARLDGGATSELRELVRRDGYFRFSCNDLHGSVLSFSLICSTNEPLSMSFNARAIADVSSPKSANLSDIYFRFAPETPLNFIVAKTDLEECREGGQIRAFADGKTIGNYASALFVPPNAVEELQNWRIPSTRNMERVAGISDFYRFFFEGYATFSVIDRVLRKSTGRAIGDFKKILDWGCGVGRVTQHLLRWTSSDIAGVDIDETAIEWCTENLAKGYFEMAPFEPPLSFDQGAFDLVIGISVLTHLDEPTEFLWLEEIQRLLSPNGVAVVTVNSLASLFSDAHPIQEFCHLQSVGISDDHIGTRLDDILPDNRKTYYREVRHSTQYVINKWCKWFDVIAIYPGAHFGHQDYVVLTHRSPAKYGEIVKTLS